MLFTNVCNFVFIITLFNLQHLKCSQFWVKPMVFFLNCVFWQETSVDHTSSHILDDDAIIYYSLILFATSLVASVDVSDYLQGHFSLIIVLSYLGSDQRFVYHQK